MAKMSISELSNELAYYISHDLDNFSFSKKEDVIGDNTFVHTVYFNKTAQEIKYVYHIDKGVREYVCLYSKENPKDIIGKFNATSVLEYTIAQIEPLYDFAKYFQMANENETDDNLRYEWNFVCKEVKFGEPGTEFPIVRIMHQSAESIMVFFMSDYGKCMIFVLNAKDYQSNPDKDILEYLYKDIQKMLEINESDHEKLPEHTSATLTMGPGPGNTDCNPCSYWNPMTHSWCLKTSYPIVPPVNPMSSPIILKE